MAKKRKCYCSFCKNQRTVFTKRHIGVFDVLFCLFAATLLTFIFWQKLDPRLSVLFVGLCILAEIFVHIRWRLSLACSFCGFDPILYLKNPEKACQKVSQFMDERRSSSSYLLASHQYDKLAKIIRKNEASNGPANDTSESSS